MSKLKKQSLALILISVFISGYSTLVSAYSCKAVFFEANALIKKAEKHVTSKTDSRILSMLEQAKGLAKAGLVNHTKAKQNHHGKIGQYTHSDSVRKGRWAVSLAKQVLFLLTTKEM